MICKLLVRIHQLIFPTHLPWWDYFFILLLSDVNYRIRLRELLSNLFSFLSFTSISSLHHAFSEAILSSDEIHILAPGSSLENYNSSSARIFRLGISRVVFSNIECDLYIWEPPHLIFLMLFQHRDILRNRTLYFKGYASIKRVFSFSPLFLLLLKYFCKLDLRLASTLYERDGISCFCSDAFICSGSSLVDSILFISSINPKASIHLYGFDFSSQYIGRRYKFDNLHTSTQAKKDLLHQVSIVKSHYSLDLQFHWLNV